MAKNKFNNVVIKDEELTPTTIGVYEHKTKSPVGIIILIILFVVAAFNLPNIQSYINKALGKTDNVPTNNNSTNNGTNTNTDKDDDDDNTDKVDDTKYDISSETIVNDASYTISDINFANGMFNFTITNRLNSEFSLKDYYLELYTSDSTFISRVKVSDESISAVASKLLSISIPTESMKFSFIKRDESNYPEVSLTYDENKEAVLTCSSGDYVYEYLFQDDQLVSINHRYTFSTSISNFESTKASYDNKVIEYSSLEGVSSNLAIDADKYIYQLNIELDKADISKISDSHIYAFKTSPKVVKFKEESTSQRYTCKQL